MFKVLEEIIKKKLRLSFADGVIEEADFILLATGVKPNTKFLECQQVRIDQGVLIDDRMSTNVANLFAAGDVSQGNNLMTGQKQVIAL